jgi:hypothetical protein
MANTDASWLSSALTTMVSNTLGADATVKTDSSGLSISVPASSNGQPTIVLEGLQSTASGLNGHLHIDGLNASTALEAEIFSGFSVGLKGFDVKLVNGGFDSSHLIGQLTIPYFTDSGKHKTIDVEIAIGQDGQVSLTLAAQQSDPANMTPDGLVKLAYSIGSGVTIELHIAAFDFDQSGSVPQLVLGGQLLIDTGSQLLNWPAIDFKGLRIDSQGHVELDGGWIDLPSQTALDYFGFHVGLQKLGFGSDQSGRWIGFNGDIHLVEGIPLGGSVRGLRLSLEHGAVSFEGVSVSFEIPGVLKFEGDIDHIQANNPTDLKNAGLSDTLATSMFSPDPTTHIIPSQINVFMGNVDLAIEAVPGLEVDAKFIVGNFGGMSVFFLALDAELPVGIPIFLDVSLYGMEGLFASNFRPDPAKIKRTWWEWYKYELGTSTKDYSATDVTKWLAFPEQDALALGAGATIGTVDDGFTASAAITFVLMLPGPVISFMGKAKIISKRVSNASDTDDSFGASFDAMATFDGRAGTFDLDIEAEYKIPLILDIEGSADVHVDVNDSSWYFALGLPPHDKRIRARIFDLFEMNSYFVVSDRGLVTGSYIGYQHEWDYGPLSVSLNAFLATAMAIQWLPLEISGGIELHGEAHLKAFGVGLGVTADALLECKAPDPFWIHGEFHVELDLPWPLPDVGANVTL